MKKNIILIIVFFIPTLLWGNSFNIQDRIKTQALYKEVHPLLFGKIEHSLTKDFKKLLATQGSERKDKIRRFIANLDQEIPSRILMPLTYWQFINHNAGNVYKILKFYGLYKILLVRDLIDNPLTEKTQKLKGMAILEKIVKKKVATDQIFDNVSPLIEQDLADYLQNPTPSAITNSIKNSNVIGISIKRDLPQVKDYVLSYLGIIPGNQVEIVSENQRNIERIKWMNDRVIFAGGKLDFSKDYMQMPTPENGNKGHICFRDDPIFQKIRDMILDAKESIFIDIFLFGGTMGGTLAKFLIDQTLLKRKNNRNFKTILLHDYATNYGLKDEILPIFEYIKKRIDNESEVANSVILLQANIQRHPPGIPFKLTDFIPKTPEVFKQIEKRNTYYESKIDHSKVVVVDGNSDSPHAYFGSKNWSDHSGAYYYDDAIYVKGPFAALVQASYYDDIDAALTLDKLEQDWFYYKELGLDNKRYLPLRSEILDYFRIKKDNYPFVGNQSARMAEANVDGMIKNVRNIIVDMILQAKHHIYLEHLFVYDPYINDALMKVKLNKPHLDIRIMADNNENFGFNGFPNTIFMKEMIDFGIKIKGRRLLGVHTVFPNNEEKEYHQENHRKMTSVDGVVLVGGSSNLNPDTLQGSFREFGAQIFDQKQIATFEQNFIRDWNDPKMTEDIDINNRALIVGGKALPIQLSNLINGLASELFRAKDKLENRH